MKKLIAMVLSAVGVMAATTASMGCFVIVLDEPEMSSKMIER